MVQPIIELGTDSSTVMSSKVSSRLREPTPNMNGEFSQPSRHILDNPVH